ncbi:MAG TPA: radical SAM family heme chaperone HemW [Acidobacteriaceae bacterium]|nr:radical SAM family heme chaperone HemW [Acidobacteriaceae bacterium]
MQKQFPNTLGLYFSIPFCRSKCTYCNFASGVYPASEHGPYTARLVEDLRASHGWAGEMGALLPAEVDTIYFGGGTPVLLEAEHFRAIFSAVRERFDVLPEAEITIEAAPGQLSDATLAAMVECGVNRVSLGVQSFVDREAQQSGRLHTRAMVLEDLQRLRAAGIANLNLDLLAGLAGQTLESWRESLTVLLETDVPHASVYMLEIDEDSRLGRELIAGGVRYGAELVPSDDAIAQMYEEAADTLEKAGIGQYEISNFARAGFESKHNLRYWQRRPYLGLGLDASSMLCAADGSVLRSTTTSELGDYLREAASPVETAWLGPVQQQEEAWFLGLRRNAGVSVAALKAEFGVEAVAPSVRVAERLAEDGLLRIEARKERRKGSRAGMGKEDRVVSLTARGRLISNDLFAEFLGVAPERELASVSNSADSSFAE